MKWTRDEWGYHTCEAGMVWQRRKGCWKALATSIPADVYTASDVTDHATLQEAKAAVEATVSSEGR
jgi:hypothetical protein